MRDKQPGFFVISLDFELIWGVFDVLDLESHLGYFQNTRKAIPEIISCFKGNNIHATWATVGMLFNEGWKEWEENIPRLKPTYKDTQLSAYGFADSNKENGTEKIFFAPELIRDIARSPGQELGTHTYSHYYCQEEGQSLNDFNADIQRAVKMGKDFGVEIKSLVFPRNQFKKEYLEICSAHGIESVRTNPDDWYWKNPSSEALQVKLFRTGDAYNLFGKRKSYALSTLKKKVNMPLEQKASRFFRPYGKNKILNHLRLKRIKDEMTAAAKKGEIYHLWWHPHNFGNYPQESMLELKELISHFKSLESNYGFASVNMAELTNIFLKKT